MKEPVALSPAARALTPKGNFYVQVMRLRESFNELPDADRIEGLELLGDLLRHSVKVETQRSA